VMYATLIAIDVRGVDREEGLRGLREGIVPAISSMPGFHSGVWLTGNDAGIGLSLTLWETEAGAQAMAERFGLGSSPQANAAVTRCEVGGRGHSAGPAGGVSQRTKETA
jgi:hypothetical protein